jgi:hypothetical protein
LKIDPILLDEIAVIFGTNYISNKESGSGIENERKVMCLIE